MFSFLDMMGNYEERKVDNYSKDGLEVDTAAITDSSKPFETAVKHPAYNGGEWISVELYDTKELAQKGHDKWVAVITSRNLHKPLKDVSDCIIAQMRFDDDEERVFKAGE